MITIVFTYNVTDHLQITDHLPIFHISSELKVIKAKKLNEKKKDRKANLDTVLTLNEDWHAVTRENDVHKAYIFLVINN